MEFMINRAKLLWEFRIGLVLSPKETTKFSDHILLCFKPNHPLVSRFKVAAWTMVKCVYRKEV